ncbi:hemerythrin domain-containing protein [Nitrospira sp. Nam74]
MKQREQSDENFDENEQGEEGGVNAVELLREDHRKVQDLFEEFEGADNRSRQRIADQALIELEIHTKLEEELVYPAIRDAIDEEDLMDEALEEHHAVELLMKELRKMGPKDERYRAKFKVMAEMVKHHIEEEESQVFPQAEESDLDLMELGQDAMMRKEKLMAKTSAGPSRSKKKSSKSAGRGRSRKRTAA